MFCLCINFLFNILWSLVKGGHGGTVAMILSTVLAHAEILLTVTVSMILSTLLALTEILLLILIF